LTVVAPVKRSPRIVTVVPARPESGEKLEIVGGVCTVNGSALVSVPPGLVTAIGPVVRCLGNRPAVVAAGQDVATADLTKVWSAAPPR
jgi:hypothetical protein